MISLDRQIEDARHKAELFARRLDEAQNCSNFEEPWRGGTTAKRGAEQQIQQQQQQQQQQHQQQPMQQVQTTALPMNTVAESGMSVASLELLIKAQQRDLVKADTDIRVCVAQNRALQQRVDELERLLQDKDEQLRLYSASRQQAGLPEREREAALHECQMQALRSAEYARTLELRLDVSEGRCKKLENRLAVTEVRLRNSFDSSDLLGAANGTVFEDDNQVRLSGDGRLNRWSSELATSTQLQLQLQGRLRMGGDESGLRLSGSGPAGITSTDKQKAIMRSSTASMELRPTMSTSEPTLAASSCFTSTANSSLKTRRKKATDSSRGSSQRVSFQKPLNPKNSRPMSAPALNPGQSRKSSSQKKAAPIESQPRIRRSIKVIVPSGGPRKNPGVPSVTSHDLINLSADSIEFTRAAVISTKQKDRKIAPTRK